VAERAPSLPVTPEIAHPAAPERAVRPVGKRRGGEHAQLNVLVPEALKREAKIKALREGRELSEVVTELLTAWLST